MTRLKDWLYPKGMEQEREDITPGRKDPEKIATSGKIATPEERQERLTEIIRANVAFPTLIKTGHVIGAIDTLNRMDGLYAVPFGFNDNRVINIICDERTKDLIGQIGERTKALTIGQERLITPETILDNNSEVAIENEKKASV